MFGNNEVRGLEGDGSQLQMREIFYTLQGEGPFSGRPAVFVRLTGCNLRCHFCDTKWDDKSDPYVTPAAIASSVWDIATAPDKSFCRLVVLTGGEPLRQDISQLLHQLIKVRGLRVQIETAGTLWQECLRKYSRDELTVVVSPKTPVINNLVRVRADAFKYVIRASDAVSEQGIPIASTQQGSIPPRVLAAPLPETPIYLSPCDEYEPANNIQNMERVAELSLKYGHIAGVQLHKLLHLD